jgi:hypothetical protein
VPGLDTLLDEHVLLDYESVDRIFFDSYVAKLQDPCQVDWFLGRDRGEELPRYELLGKMIRGGFHNHAGSHGPGHTEPGSGWT